MKRSLTILLLITLYTGVAQRNFDDVEIRTEKVAGQIYVLFGAGGNIGLAIGDDAAYLIDDQYAPLTEKIRGPTGSTPEPPNPERTDRRPGINRAETPEQEWQPQ